VGRDACGRGAPSVHIRDAPTARFLDPTKRIGRVDHAATEAIEIPDDDRPNLVPSDALDRLLPLRASGVTTASIELLEHLDELEAFAPTDAADALRLQGLRELSPSRLPTRLTRT
jgi:hypothetical protein